MWTRKYRCETGSKKKISQALQSTDGTEQHRTAKKEIQGTETIESRTYKEKPSTNRRSWTAKIGVLSPSLAGAKNRSSKD
ncbi:hypothetical protein NL676_036699 [Syzygium grande]|nr:hypothetical protein NL676_036699 [Syzygium grande]